MFSSEVGTAGYSLGARTFGIFLGTVILVSVAAALISAKTVPFGFVLTLASFLAVGLVRGQIASAVPRASPVSLHLAGLLLYAVVSSAWSIDPAAAFGTTLLALLIGIGTVSMLQLIEPETRPNLLHMGEGLWIGLGVALAYLVVEMATDQSIKIWIYNLVGLKEGELAPPSYFQWEAGKLVGISREDLTRNMAPLSLYLWPAVAALLGTQPRPRAMVIAFATVLISAAVVLLSGHETSKAAIVCGIGTFALAWGAPRLTGHITAVAWICVCLAVLPAALLAHRLDLHDASWMQYSAKHRIIIWNYTAEQVLKAPWFGVGARTTYVLGPKLEAEGLTTSEGKLRRTLSTHSHSVYLQTWFELGLVGASLLTLLGLAILQAIAALAPRKQPYVYATFVSAAIMAASSFGMWQFWFMALFGYSALLFGLGSRLLDGAPAAAPAKA